MALYHRISKTFLQAGVLSAAFLTSTVLAQASPTTQASAPTSALSDLPAPTPSPRLSTVESRPLTEGERRLVSVLFGSTIGAEDLRVAFSSQDRSRLPISADSADAAAIHIYGDQNSSQDFSSADAELFGVFVNEATRTIQARKGKEWRANTRDETGNPAYTFKNSGRDDFSSYTPSQQRAILEDYARRFLHPGRETYWLSATYGGDREATDVRLGEIVESVFPEAQSARLAANNIQGRPLTPGEEALIRSIFGDRIDTTQIHLNLAPQAYVDTAGNAHSDGKVFFFGAKFFSDDYSLDTDVDRFGVFVHEITHIWQFQTNRRYTVKTRGQYAYSIEADSRFDTFSIEQQASMVEDYARRYLHPGARFNRLRLTYGPEELQTRAGYLVATVEAWFPDTQRTHRQALLARPFQEPPKKPTQPRYIEVTIRSVPGILPPSPEAAPARTPAPTAQTPVSP